jgi:hypothetical protein
VDFLRGQGADAVIDFSSSSSDNKPQHLATTVKQHAQKGGDGGMDPLAWIKQRELVVERLLLLV